MSEEEIIKTMKDDYNGKGKDLGLYESFRYFARKEGILMPKSFEELLDWFRATRPTLDLRRFTRHDLKHFSRYKLGNGMKSNRIAKALYNDPIYRGNLSELMVRIGVQSFREVTDYEDHVICLEMPYTIEEMMEISAEQGEQESSKREQKENPSMYNFKEVADKQMEELKIAAHEGAWPFGKRKKGSKLEHEKE